MTTPLPISSRSRSTIVDATVYNGVFHFVQCTMTSPGNDARTHVLLDDDTIVPTSELDGDRLLPDDRIRMVFSSVPTERSEWLELKRTTLGMPLAEAAKRTHRIVCRDETMRHFGIRSTTTPDVITYVRVDDAHGFYGPIVPEEPVDPTPAPTSAPFVRDTTGEDVPSPDGNAQEFTSEDERAMREIEEDYNRKKWEKVRQENEKKMEEARALARSSLDKMLTLGSSRPPPLSLSRPAVLRGADAQDAVGYTPPSALPPVVPPPISRRAEPPTERVQARSKRRLTLADDDENELEDLPPSPTSPGKPAEPEVITSETIHLHVDRIVQLFSLKCFETNSRDSSGKVKRTWLKTSEPLEWFWHRFLPIAMGNNRGYTACSPATREKIRQRIHTEVMLDDPDVDSRGYLVEFHLVDTDRFVPTIIDAKRTKRG